MARRLITYVTSNPFKSDELEIIVANCKLSDGRSVSEVYEFEIRALELKETLDVSLEAIVLAEARDAYAKTRVPVIVEHAGLVFMNHLESEYPGGLTKPMWNSLGDAFLDETNSRGRSVLARAFIGYCDGQQAIAFVGETEGTLASNPRGDREFYWDVVFVPSGENESEMTYAEIVGDPSLGLRHKVLTHSQSRKAIMAFLEWRLNNAPALWNITK